MDTKSLFAASAMTLASVAAHAQSETAAPRMDAKLDPRIELKNHVRLDSVVTDADGETTAYMTRSGDLLEKGYLTGHAKDNVLRVNDVTDFATRSHDVSPGGTSYHTRQDEVANFANKKAEFAQEVTFVKVGIVDVRENVTSSNNKAPYDNSEAKRFFKIK